MKSFLKFTVLLFCCCLYDLVFYAQSIDPAFGVNGRFQPNDSPLMTTRKIEVSDNGNIYALFSADFFASEDLAANNGIFGVLYRLLPNGEVDVQFGNNGSAVLSTSGFIRTTVRDFIIAANGDIVICGLAANDTPFQETPVIFRLLENGQADSNFGTNGTRTYSLFQGGFVSLAERGNGQLIVASNTYNINGNFTEEDVRIIRTSATGDIDPSFGIAGEYLLNTTNKEYVKGVLINDNDQVIFYGHYYTCIVSDCYLNNYMYFGDADLNQYVESGISTFQNAFAPIYDMHDGLITPDNEFVGISTTYQNDGTAGPTFHTYFLNDFFGNDQGFLTINGNIRVITVLERENAAAYLVAGFAADGTSPVNLIVSQRNSDGTVNPNFNGGLPFTFSIDNKDAQRIRTSALQNDGGMLLGIEAFDVAENEDWFNFEDDAVASKIACIVRFIPTCITGVGILPFETACAGEAVTLTPDATYLTYQWSNGSTSSTNTITQPGIYTLNVTNDDGCSGSVSVDVAFNPIPSTPIITQNGNTLTATGAGDFSWALNNNPISNNNSNSLIITELGNYSVTITDENGCSSAEGSLLVSIISTNELDQHNTFIYPNPAINNINLLLPSIGIYSVTITDVTGKIISTSQISGASAQLDISQLSIGFYQINALSETESVLARFMKANN
jgi:hypothetical protein